MGGSLWSAGMGAMVAYFMFIFMNGNPTQHVDKLFKMMSQGMAGKESVAAFDKVYTSVDGNTQHNAYDGDVARSFYNLATEFYEYGWGDSFHFGVRTRSEPHSKCIANSQNFVATKLRVGNFDKVLDMGCGIGGPLRGVVRATGANVTGLSINEHQIMRGKEITAGLSPWMQERCHFMVQDYLAVKGLEENSYDAAFYMESSLHCEDRTKTFKEAFRLLKPGGRLVAMEYYLLPGWEPNNPEHKELMRRHLYGNGAAKTPTIEDGLKQITDAGLAELEKVFGVDAWPWWADLQFNWAPDLLPAHPWIRTPLPHLLRVLSKIGLVPPDVPAAAELMNEGGDGLSGLGKVGAITPQYYVGAIKPL
ncbi:S-adenosyl-L-methionine-dependent methyltransferase [Pavlovales sp. CCMP2436]|nr:S-adenosyl-L-methionine-dependent methyltransferase [Pavlovales sp. CCMP2436]